MLIQGFKVICEELRHVYHRHEWNQLILSVDSGHWDTGILGSNSVRGVFMCRQRPCEGPTPVHGFVRNVRRAVTNIFKHGRRSNGAAAPTYWSKQKQDYYFRGNCNMVSRVLRRWTPVIVMAVLQPPRSGTAYKHYSLQNIPTLDLAGLAYTAWTTDFPDVTWRTYVSNGLSNRFSVMREKN